MKLLSHLYLILMLAMNTAAQDNAPFRVTLEPMIPKDFPGLQSYAWAKDGDRVLLVGGRKDGLHRRQPFAAFNKKYNNIDLLVIDLKKEKTWTKSVSSLPSALAEQLQSTNMEFYQQGNQLIIIGGYGYSATNSDHITYPSVISIRVNELINAIINEKDMAPWFSQLTDERMAVTGGRLNKLGNLLYLVGGQRFDGRYNPHGPDHGPGFSQQYSNQVRKFSLTVKNGGLQIENYEAVTDSLLFHRRDYNLLPQLDAKGNAMLTIYSGVFQYNKDVPFTNLVDIRESGHTEVPGFEQQFCHYHTATLSVYSKKNNTTWSVFLGGIAQKYTDSAGQVITDNDVPFVKHISVVERKGNTLKEYILPDPMPGYFGAAAEFIPADQKLFTENGMLDFDKAGKKELLTGFIIGGIDSRARNVFWSNEADPSRASPVVWKVYLTRR